MRVAVWDLGSSSFHLLVCEVGPGRTLEPVLRRRALLNLGSAVGASGEIPSERAGAALAAARRLRRHYDAVRPELTVALATAALRDAANGADVVGRLERALDVPVKVLDGEEEARLCFAGQRAAVWMPPGPALGLDLGGGSLELAVGDGRRLELATSIPVGATRLSGELHTSDPLTPEQARAIAEKTEAALGPVLPVLHRHRGVATRTVVSGGTARALARLATARVRRRSPGSGDVDQVELAVGQVEQMAARLGAIGLAERLALPGMSSRRAPVLPIGAQILQATARVLGVDRFVVSEWGLREGAILDALATA